MSDKASDDAILQTYVETEKLLPETWDETKLLILDYVGLESLVENLVELVGFRLSYEKT